MKKTLIPANRRRLYELDIQTIQFYRNNPCIACEHLIGIQLTDEQAYILQNMWNAQYSAICCCRDFGKSFIGAIFMILKAILYENQSIYIVSSVGKQSKETFQKIEEIVTRVGKTAASIRSLKDIVINETKKNISNKDGFSHNPESWCVEFYNGSKISTLNSNPDRNRGHRATLIFFDEAAYCSDELISACEAFTAQNTEFVSDIDQSYNPELAPRKIPTQQVYVSSQGEMDKIFYKNYKNYAKRMLAGDRNYFVCDMICETAITPHMKGKPYTGLITWEKVETQLAVDKEKGLREYYNRPIQDGGNAQIVKLHTIKRSEQFFLPTLHWKPESRIVMAFDPARTMDNSILSVMNVYKDGRYGFVGDIINCVNMVDIETKQKYKLDSNRQIEYLRKYLLAYNGNNPDYEYIDSLLIDAGSGGGGTSTYADGLLNEWYDDRNIAHRGLIDSTNEIYTTYVRKYPDACDKLRLISPRKYRTQMVEEFIELMDLGVIRFPYEYNGQDILSIPKANGTNNIEEHMEDYELSDEEKLSLIQIDLMKNEILSIRKTTNSEKTSVTYALAKEKENRMHDDRFYTIILLAHRLYEIRRVNALRQKPKMSKKIFIEAKKPRLYNRK